MPPVLELERLHTVWERDTRTHIAAQNTLAAAAAGQTISGRGVTWPTNRMTDWLIDRRTSAVNTRIQSIKTRGSIGANSFILWRSNFRVLDGIWSEYIGSA
jgi:hypothetical protein